MTESGIKVQLSTESVVNQRTGVVERPSEYVESLRLLEDTVQRCDDQIGELQAELKSTRIAREKAIAALRSAIREGTVMPLLDAIEGGDGVAAGGASEA